MEVKFNGMVAETNKIKYSVKQNNNSNVIVFKIAKNQDQIILDKNNHWYVKVQSCVCKEFFDKDPRAVVTEDENNIYVAWTMLRKHTQFKNIDVQIQYEVPSSDIVWQTAIINIDLFGHIPADEEIENLYPSILTYLQEEIDNHEQRIQALEQGQVTLSWGNITGDIHDQEDLMEEFGKDRTAIEENADAIETEKNAREQADSVLSQAISDEEERAKDAEDGLDERIDDIEKLIPNEASEENQLADKNWTNSSIATNTATFRGTFDVEDLGLTQQATHEQVAQALKTAITTTTNNDYAFVFFTNETTGLVERYDRYKYSASSEEWGFEFTLNNSSFTAQQWEAINSGITSGKLAIYDGYADLISAIQTELQDCAKTDEANTFSETNTHTAPLVLSATYLRIFSRNDYKWEFYNDAGGANLGIGYRTANDSLQRKYQFASTAFYPASNNSNDLGISSSHFREGFINKLTGATQSADTDDIIKGLTGMDAPTSTTLTDDQIAKIVKSGVVLDGSFSGFEALTLLKPRETTTGYNGIFLTNNAIGEYNINKTNKSFYFYNASLEKAINLRSIQYINGMLLSNAPTDKTKQYKWILEKTTGNINFVEDTGGGGIEFNPSGYIIQQGSAFVSVNELPAQYTGVAYQFSTTGLITTSYVSGVLQHTISQNANTGKVLIDGQQAITSSNVLKTLKISQEDYDALETKDASTLYLIVG